MSDPGPTDPASPHPEEVAHLALQIGRLLLGSGADTAQVQISIEQFVARFGQEAHVVVGYESILLTIIAGGQFRTKIGYRIPALNVNLGAVTAVNSLISDTESSRRDLAKIRAELERIESSRPIYARWVVIIALGLTAGSLARLFVGDWASVGVSWLAGSAGMWLRQELGLRKFNLFFIPFAAALASGIIGGVAVSLGPAKHLLCAWWRPQ